jgi:exocyst complex component 4
MSLTKHAVFHAVRRFQALLETYQQLAELILGTIRIDIRCRTMHYLDSAMRHVMCLLYSQPFELMRSTQGNYYIDREAGEPDPHVVDLNMELGKCDNFMSTAIPKKEQQYDMIYLCPKHVLNSTSGLYL